MNIFVETYNDFEGVHCWPGAHGEFAYLANPHRHHFIIKTLVRVQNADREVEIFDMENKITRYIRKEYGAPCDFGTMSCESIAIDLLNHFVSIQSVEVKEDGFGGSIVQR